MELAFHKFGEGKPLIILHGLYGSSENWLTIGKRLSEHFTVYLIDQRNHGNSPHHPEHSYEAMRNDLYEFINSHHLEHVILIGHSMGGKTAISFVLKYGEFIDKLIVVDMSPVDYTNSEHAHQTAKHNKIISTLNLMEPGSIRDHREADHLLQNVIPQQKVRQFLLKNLKRNHYGTYKWTFNIEAFAKNTEKLSAGVVETDQVSFIISNVPALFIKSEFSNYITDEDENVISRVFPSSRIIQIPGTGHWLHADQPELFIEAVLDFLT